MGEVRVTQDDRDAAANAWARRFGKSHFEDEIMDVFEGRNDQHPLVQDFARHRQAAEKAQQERDAGIAEAKTRDQNFNDPWDDGWDAACENIATAIRSQGHE